MVETPTCSSHCPGLVTAERCSEVIAQFRLATTAQARQQSVDLKLSTAALLSSLSPPSHSAGDTLLSTAQLHQQFTYFLLLFACCDTPRSVLATASELSTLFPHNNAEHIYRYGAEPQKARASGPGVTFWAVHM